MQKVHVEISRARDRVEEAPGVPLDDVVEVSNYVMALEHGLRRLREGLPLCNRLIREMHAALLRHGPDALPCTPDDVAGAPPPYGDPVMQPARELAASGRNCLTG